MKITNTFTMIAFVALGCAPLDEEVSRAPQEIISGDDDHPQSAGYLRLRVGGALCTATVVRPDWVLTARCISPTTQAANVRVDLGSLTTPAVEIVRHPSAPLALVRLQQSVPFTPRVLGSTTAAQLPLSELRCHGWGGGALSGRFFAQGSTGTVHTLRDARRSPNAVFVGDVDIGGPCELESGPSSGALVGLLFDSKPTCVNAQTCAIDGSIIRAEFFRPWVDVVITARTTGTLTILRNPTNNQCWDVPSRSLQDGERVNQFPCHFGDNQSVYEVPVGATAFRTIVMAHSGYCVEVRGLGDGARLHQATCNGGTNQQWSIVPSNGGFSLRPRSEPQRCVDIPNGVWSPAGTQLQIHGCHGANNQTWTHQR